MRLIFIVTVITALISLNGYAQNSDTMTVTAPEVLTAPEALAEPAAAPAPASASDAPVTPIRVVKADMETATFTRLLVKSSTSFEIGVAPGEIAIWFIEMLNSYGYNTLGAENVLFNVDHSAKARFQIGGVMTIPECVHPSNVRWRMCDAEITWEVFDTRSNTVSYRTITRARQKLYDNREFEVEHFQALVRYAFQSVLTRPAFVATLSRRTAGTGTADLFIDAAYKKCGNSSSAPLPQKAADVVKGTVLIEVGGAIGSGVIISPDGFILTANHVVSGLQTVKIRTAEGSEGEAKVIRQSPEADVALLKTDLVKMSCLTGNSTLPTLGAEVFAVGAPLEKDLAFSVSRGIVSGLRTVDGFSVLQTDASVNPGNSGGPLLDSQGKIVGIVTSKISGTAVEGIGFGISLSDALRVLKVHEGNTTNSALTVFIPHSTESTETVVDPADPLFPDARAVALQESQKKSQFSQANYASLNEFEELQEELELADSKKYRRIASAGALTLGIGSLLTGISVVLLVVQDDGDYTAAGVLFGVGFTAILTGTIILIVNAVQRDKKKKQLSLNGFSTQPPMPALRWTGVGFSFQ